MPPLIRVFTLQDSFTSPSGIEIESFIWSEQGVVFCMNNTVTYLYLPCVWWHSDQRRKHERSAACSLASFAGKVTSYINICSNCKNLLLLQVQCLFLVINAIFWQRISSPIYFSYYIDITKG